MISPHPFQKGYSGVSNKIPQDCRNENSKVTQIKRPEEALCLPCQCTSLWNMYFCVCGSNFYKLLAQVHLTFKDVVVEIWRIRSCSFPVRYEVRG